MLQSVTGELLQCDSYFIFLGFIRELLHGIAIYPCVQFAILIGICNIKFNGIGCYVAIRVSFSGSVTDVDVRHNRFLVFDGLLVRTANRIFKPDVKVVFLFVDFYIFECNCIFSLFCSKGL